MINQSEDLEDALTRPFFRRDDHITFIQSAMAPRF